MRKLITLLTAVLASTAAWAQFDEPELQPAKQVKIDGTTEYYMSITNSDGDEYFYGQGNNWGTRASVRELQEDAKTVRFSTATYTLNGETHNGVKFADLIDGTWKAVDCDGAKKAWVDGQGRQGDGAWTVVDLGNGKIELLNAFAPDGKFGVVASMTIWNEDANDYILSIYDNAPEDYSGGQHLDYGFDSRLYFYGSTVADSVNVLNEDGEVIGKRVKYIYGDEAYTTWQLYEAGTYNARKKICDWYWDGDGEFSGAELADEYPSVMAAVEAAQKIYDNPDATVEELNAAYAAILTAVDWLAVEENAAMLEGASADDPIDATFVITNPAFDEGMTGWEGSSVGDANVHVQGDHYGSGNSEINTFIEAWRWNAKLGNGRIFTTIAVPAGMYKLSANIIANKQYDGGNKSTSLGAFLYAKDNVNDNTLPVATNNNSPEHFELEFTTDGGKIEIGVRTENPTINWLAADNWSLTYYGNSGLTFAQIALRDKVAALGEEYGTLEIYGNKAVIDAYDALYEEVAVLAEAAELSDEDCQMWSDSIQNAMNALKATINDYKNFANLLETFQERIDQIREAGYPECADELADYRDAAANEYEECVWGAEEIKTVLYPISDVLGKYVGPSVKPGDDVSLMLTNPEFTKNFSGWNITVDNYIGYMKNLGQGPNAHADLCQETPAEDDGLAECFHQNFDMSQTLKNVPAGLYTLSVQGFNRSDDGVNEPAVLYATFSNGEEQTVNIADINDYKTEDRLYVVGTLNEETGEITDIQWQSDAGRDNNTFWVPNGMSGAAWHFVNKKDGENYDYTNKFSILMKEAGDLTVGVRVKNAHQWVIWDNFTLVYEGSGASVFIPTLEEEMAKLESAATEADITDGEFEEIDKVIKKAEALIKDINNHTEDDCMDMLAELKAQYAEIDLNIALGKEIESYSDQVEALEEKAEEADDDLKARYDKIVEIVFGDYFTMNNEEMKAAIEEIKAVMALVKMPKGWEKASDENPVDFTAMILNPQFNVDGETYEPDEDGWIEEPEAVQNHNFTEWQGKQFGTGGGEAANCGEAWNSGAFNAYQKITGLPEGTYVLSCQGFLRHGGGGADSYAILNGAKEQQVYAYLYGVSSEGQYSTELCNIAQYAMTQMELDSLGISGQTAEFTAANGEKYKTPEQLAIADQIFKEGYYNNSITVKVGKDGVLRVGIEKINAVQYDWVVVDNFSLMYLGNGSTAETSDDPKTGINEMEAPVQQATYTLTGLRVNKIAKPGLYIIGGKKVLVK